MYEFEAKALEGFLMHQINGCVSGECPGEYTGPHIQCDGGSCNYCYGQDCVDHMGQILPREVESSRRGMQPG